MKYIHAISAAAALATALLAACNAVDTDERYIELPKVEVNGKVLLEDFTGQMCTNCPKAHAVIATLQEQYPGNVVAVGIHAGQFGLAEGGKQTGLMLPEGNEYATHAGVSAYPAGVVNRQGGAIDPSDWSEAVRQQLEKKAHADIKLAAHITPEGGATAIAIETTVKAYAQTDAKLQLWITESGIAALQLNAGKLIKDYTHNHVYRGSVNGIWGEPISLAPQTDKTMTHSIAVKDCWNTANLHVIAFLYNDSEGVLQVEEAEVK